jgi:hypothetical protein
LLAFCSTISGHTTVHIDGYAHNQAGHEARQNARPPSLAGLVMVANGDGRCSDG